MAVEDINATARAAAEAADRLANAANKLADDAAKLAFKLHVFDLRPGPATEASP